MRLKKAVNPTIKSFCERDLKSDEPKNAGTWYPAGKYMAVRYKFIDDRHIKLSIMDYNKILVGINQAKPRKGVFLDNIQVVSKECYEDFTTYDFIKEQNEFMHTFWTCSRVDINRLETILTTFENVFSKQYAFYLTRLDHNPEKGKAYMELVQSVATTELLVMKGTRADRYIKDYTCNKEELMAEINGNIKYYKTLYGVI